MFQKVVIQERRKREGGREKYWDWLRISRKEDPCMLVEGAREESDSKWGEGSILPGKPQSHWVRNA